jgi:hypothetical protein
MKFLANILTEKNFPSEGIYNVVNSKNNLIEGIPTLVIGWGFTKLNYPNANILDWEIDKMTYWTFGMREKRQRYEADIKKFKENIFNKLFKMVRYEYINLLIKDNCIDSLLTILKYTDNLNVYINNDMLYIMCKNTNIIYGYSLRDIEYIGGKKKEVFTTIYSNKNINLIDSKEDLSLDIKLLLKNNQHIVPYLF